MTPPQKKKSSTTKSAKKATDRASAKKAVPKKRSKTKVAKKAPAAAKKGASKRTSGKAPAKKGAAADPVSGAGGDLDACAALTTKGTRCRLKPKGGIFCARHAESGTEIAPEATAAVARVAPSRKNGQATEASVESMSLPEVEAETLHAHGEAPLVEGPAQGRGKRVRRPARASKSDPVDADAEAPSRSETDTEGDEATEEPSEDDDYVLYGSVYSTTLEASPYDDMMTTEMAEGAEDVDLVDENQMGRTGGGGRGRGRRGGPPQGQRRPPVPDAPRMSKEDAEAKALEKLGPRPNIAPEEDLDGALAAYDRKFNDEVQTLMVGRRKRGRRGGRRRRGRGKGRGSGDGEGGQKTGGPQEGGRPGGGRARRGGRRRRGGGGQGGGGSSGGSGGGGGRPSGGRSGGGAPKNVGRDSPLANKRSSRGPKRGVQPRRRRDPDV